VSPFFHNRVAFGDTSKCRLLAKARRVLRHTDTVTLCLKAVRFANKNGKASASVSSNF
jgi:hypothetical protein